MIEVIVTSKNREADNIISLELARADGNLLPPFEPGSHIDVHLPNGLTRQYSLCNPSNDQTRYRLCILKEPASRGGSDFLHTRTEVNQRLSISEPRNLFPMVPDAKRTLLFAGGIGITPLLCMADALADAQADFELHYSGKSLNRMAFVNQIMQGRLADQTHLHISDSQPSQRLDVEPLLAHPQSGTHLYVCGPERYMDYVLNSAARLGWPSAQLHREYFSAAPTTDQKSGCFEIEIKSTGQILEVPADRTALQILEEAGFYIPVSCEEGVCGTCLTRVLSGDPDHRDRFLSEQERAANDQFTPCCSRSRNGRLVLDL
jgi:vanillate monooxygenase ferredoxin subunit